VKLSLRTPRRLDTYSEIVFKLGTCWSWATSRLRRFTPRKMLQAPPDRKNIHLNYRTFLNIFDPIRKEV
jgi:hypothetical protein